MEKLKEIELLYVEDDTETREFVSMILRRRFKTIHTAENGQIGLELFKKHKFPLVITDIKMPVMNGVEMIEQIRQDTSVTPLVVVTTAHREQELHSPLADMHVFKPIDVYQLLEKTLELLNQRDAQQQFGF